MRAKVFILCLLLASAQAEPQLLQNLINIGNNTLSFVSNLLIGTAVSGSVSATSGNTTISGNSTLAGNFPLLNLLDTVVQSGLSALSTVTSNVGAATSSALSSTATVLGSSITTLLNGVANVVSNISTALTASATVTNGNLLISNLNNVVANVNSSVGAAATLLNTSTVEIALGNALPTLYIDLQTAVQAIQNASSTGATGTSLLSALGTNGTNAVNKVLADAANILYTLSTIPVQLSAATGVNATLGSYYSVPYTEGAINAVNSSVNSALANANSILNNAVNTVSSLRTRIPAITNYTLSTAATSLNAAINNLKNANPVAQIQASALIPPINNAVNLALQNLTSLAVTFQLDAQNFIDASLDNITQTNASIAADANSVITTMLENLSSNEATVVNCSKEYLPVALRLETFYVTELGSCAVQASTVLNLLLGNTNAVINSAVTNIGTNTGTAYGCVSFVWLTNTCSTVTLPNAPGYINNVTKDVVKIKSAEVATLAGTGESVTACTANYASAAANAFDRLLQQYDQCISFRKLVYSVL